jgi:hypothetical protein
MDMDKVQVELWLVQNELRMMDSVVVNGPTSDPGQEADLKG